MSDYQFPTDYQLSGSQEAPGVVTPRPFAEIPSLWLKVHQMTEDFFAQEARHTSAGNTLIYVLIYTIIAAILNAIYMVIYNASTFTELASQLGDSGGMGTTGILIASVCFTAIMGPIGYYFGVALIHLGAMVFGGKGSYSTLAYLSSLFVVPLGIVISLASLIPCAGAVVALAGACIHGYLHVPLQSHLSDGHRQSSPGLFSVPGGLLWFYLAVVA
jgi:hypothetical protein